MTAARTGIALVVDDHSLYRVGLSLLLKDQLGFGRVIEASGFDEALDRLADTTDIHLALFDLSMPGMGGPQSLAVVRASYPELRIAVVSGSEERANVERALAANLHGYIPKSLPDADIVAALREIVAGRIYMPRFTTAASPATAPALASERTTLEGLTPRQRDVLAGIVRGLANKEIARELDIAEGTVKIHLAALFAHFDVRNRTELATRAQRLIGN